LCSYYAGNNFNEQIMKEEYYIERIVRIVAGSFVQISLLLAHFHSPNWLWFTCFVGLNLFKSGFTQFCPMFSILGKWVFPASRGARTAIIEDSPYCV
jgi:hypothetical protein